MLRQLQQEGNRKYVGLAAFGLIDRIVLYGNKMFTPFYHLKVGGLLYHHHQQQQAYLFH